MPVLSIQGAAVPLEHYNMCGMLKKVCCAGEDLRAALDDILAGRPVGKPIKPSVGCNIKWHP